MQRLRLMLPPLRELAPQTAVACGIVGKDGWILSSETLPLIEAGRRWVGARVDALLHPDDMTLMQVDLPPLPSARMRVAVSGAIEPFLLGDPSSVSLAFGKHGADGHVPVAWVDREAVQTLQTTFDGCGLVLRALYPTPFFLPVTEAGWTAWWTGGHVAVRTGVESGFIHLIDRQDGDTTSVPHPAALAGLVDLITQAMPSTVVWAGEVPDWWPADGPAASAMPPMPCWDGLLPGWAIIPAENGPPSADNGWGSAVALCALAALTWMVGFNLYAGRLEREGLALDANLSQRVQQAFPSIRAVVDPLKQVRQQRAAQRAAVGDSTGADFAFLVQAASRHMAFATGQVQSLRYENGALDLVLVRGAVGVPVVAPAAQAPPPGQPAANTAKPARAASGRASAAQSTVAPSVSEAWVEAARQDGVAVEPIDAGWRLRRGPPAPTQTDSGVRSSRAPT